MPSMTHSESLKELAPALAKAQGEIKHATEASRNDHFGSSYAALTQVWDAVREPLGKYGISVSQWPCAEDGAVGVETFLLHTSGEWMLGCLMIPVERKNAHGVMSAITYAKRGMLSAVCGVVSEADDDGNAANDAPPPKPAKKAAAKQAGPVKLKKVDKPEPFDFEKASKAIEVCTDPAGKFTDSEYLREVIVPGLPVRSEETTMRVPEAKVLLGLCDAKAGEIADPPSATKIYALTNQVRVMLPEASQLEKDGNEAF